MTSLAELGAISKAQDDAQKQRNQRNANAAMIGGGGTAAGFGLLAGGVPGVRPDPDKINAWKEKPSSPSGGKVRQGAQHIRVKAPVLRSAPGGIFGYREQAHRRFRTQSANEQKHYEKEAPSAKQNRKVNFQRGKELGKLPVEDEIVRHMKTGRKLGHGLLAAGAGTAGYGLYRNKKMREQQASFDSKTHPVKKEWDREKFERRSSAAAGAGAATAAASGGATALLGRQKKKWNERAQESTDAADKIIPKMRGVHDDQIVGNEGKGIKGDPNKYLAGKSRKQIQEAAQHRGAATQARYFARTYGKNAKVFNRYVRNPALGVAAAGAAGLGGSKAYDKYKQR